MVKNGILGLFVRNFRKRKSFSQERLAIKSGLSPNYIWRVENPEKAGGRSRLSEKCLKSLADALELNGRERAGLYLASVLANIEDRKAADFLDDIIDIDIILDRNCSEERSLSELFSFFKENFRSWK